MYIFRKEKWVTCFNITQGDYLPSWVDKCDGKEAVFNVAQNRFYVYPDIVNAGTDVKFPVKLQWCEDTTERPIIPPAKLPKEEVRTRKEVKTLFNNSFKEFETEMTNLLNYGYSIVSANTLIDHDDDFVWTAILVREVRVHDNEENM